MVVHMTSTEQLASRSIGYRIREAREAKGLTQEALCGLMDIADRQSISAIENGQRGIKPQELVLFSELLGVSLDYLLDPFSVAGEATFSWRASDTIREDHVRAFELKTSKVIGLLRWLRMKNSDQTSPWKRTLMIGEDSSYEFVRDRAKQVARELSLGEIPAIDLIEKIETKLDIPVLFVDVDPLPEGVWISGATVHLPDLGVILVNRGECLARRNFDVAHELFHALTWDTLPPDRFDLDKSRKRVEQLANNFAAALLMPVESIENLLKSDLINDPSHVCSVATKLQVSTAALGYRLLNLGKIEKTYAASLASIGDSTAKGQCPKLFSRSFTTLLNETIDRGRLSARKAAKAIDMDLLQLTRHFGEYELSAPFEI